MKKYSVRMFFFFLFVGSSYLLYQWQFAKPTVLPVQTVYAFDFTNPKELVGWSDHVFIGKTIKKLGEGPTSGRPKTQFSVQVMQNIKGELGKEAVVSQIAGHIQKGMKTFFVIDEHDTLIEEGKVYLFAGRIDKKGTITLVIGAGNQFIQDTNMIKEMVSTMQQAKKEQILNPDEVRLTELLQ